MFHRIALAAAAALIASPALAHTGSDEMLGMVHGFLHPLGGLDHVLAMVCVGLFASLLGGRALWAVPAAFVAMMLAGGAAGLTGAALPAVELGIAVSIIVIGGVTALRLNWPVSAAMALVGVFAVFHGYAHGAEMPLDAGALAYSLGFALATALLHAAGVGAGMAIQRPAFVRLAGAATALVGIVLLAA